MKSPRNLPGFTIVELLVVGLILAVLLVVAVPSIGGARSASGVQQSFSNLTSVSLAHVLYAADWDGRQVTWVKDDLGAYGGDVVQYNEAHDCPPGHVGPPCHPPIIAGIGPAYSGDWVTWAYWAQSSNRAMFHPIAFLGGPGAEYWGHFRFPNIRPFHDYLNGRYQDRVFYAPKDTIVVDPIEHCLDVPAEFVGYPFEECNPAWSSYALSPAAMYHPDAMRSNAAGGWQAPWTLDHGYESPGLFQAAYPDLKTHMLEHSWLSRPLQPRLHRLRALLLQPQHRLGTGHALLRRQRPASTQHRGPVRRLPGPRANRRRGRPVAPGNIVRRERVSHRRQLRLRAFEPPRAHDRRHPGP
jgi:type II secretory pathway pseudopilin PulG